MSDPGVRLRVMTWNVRYFGHGTHGLRASDAWIRRLAWVVAGLPTVPDVIALQEVEHGSLRGGAAPQLGRFVDHLHAALAANRSSARFDARYFPAHRYGRLYTTGLAVLVSDRHPIDAADAREITHVRWAPAARWKQRRIAARVTLRPHGASRPLHLVNTHLSLPAFFEVGPHRLPDRMGHGSNQLAEAEALLGQLPDGDTDVIVVGDFNSAPGSPVYDRLTARLVDPYRGADAETAAFLHRRMHLDHLFSSPSVRWDGVEAYSVDAGPFRGLSDHAPKIGRLAA
ncbi:MAG: endonuclease/exonuclease/phosphatase family protein [Myxococcota bacterium]